MDHSVEIGALSEALAKAQGEIRGAIRDSDNPFYKSRYADLASIWEAIREPLSRHQLAVSQHPESQDGTITVHTLMSHPSGQWIRSSLTMTPVKADPQGVGSCITYARRYALAAMCGVAPEDDDGNLASGKDLRPALKASIAAVRAKKEAQPSPTIHPGHCTLKGCGGELQEYRSLSEAHPGRPYIQCEKAHETKTRLLEKGMNNRDANASVAGHYRAWLDEVPQPA